MQEEKLNLEEWIAQMKSQAATIQRLVEGVSDEQARWKPNLDDWSILEVVNHLHDEERRDFRVRLDIILHHPEAPWPPIDPQGWVKEYGYNQRDLAESVANFQTEREQSIRWLREVAPINFEALYISPFGQMKAGEMFASWVAHDLLHIRQLVELHWAYTVQRLHPYQVEYAGEW